VAYHVGLDLAEGTDYTALAAVHEVVEPTKEDTQERRLQLSFLHRFPRRTPYDEIAAAVAGFMQNPDLRPDVVHAYAPSGRPLLVKKDKPPALVVDDTGVGRGIARWLKKYGVKPLVGVTITGSRGGKAQPDPHEGGRWRVPKTQLVFDLINAVDTQRLEVPRGLDQWDVLREELLRFSRKQNEQTGHVRYEHEKAGDHDDMVIALALALWNVKRPRSAFKVIR
jgi:hypothetical protein